MKYIHRKVCYNCDEFLTHETPSCTPINGDLTDVKNRNCGAWKPIPNSDYCNAPDFVHYLFGISIGEYKAKFSEFMKASPEDTLN